MRTSLLLLSILLPISPTIVYSWNETATTEISLEPSTTFSNDILQNQKIGLVVLLGCLCASAIFGAKRALFPTTATEIKDSENQL